MNERTVLSFNSRFAVGTFFHGNQPHPASLPPGVWYNLKLSPSPTLVTWPKTLFRRKYEDGILTASGKRRRRLLRRKARRIEVVRTAVGMMVRSSNQADQSVTLRHESQPLGAEEEVAAAGCWLGWCWCPASGCGSESFSGGHGITTHALSVEGDRPVELRKLRSPSSTW